MSEHEAYHAASEFHVNGPRYLWSTIAEDGKYIRGVHNTVLDGFSCLGVGGREVGPSVPKPASYLMMMNSSSN